MHFHAAAAVVAVMLGYVCTISRGEWAMVIVAIGFVFATELCNSAVEALIDIAIPRVSAGVKHVKDMVAASVLVAAITALCIAFLVFFPHLLILFGYH